MVFYTNAVASDRAGGEIILQCKHRPASSVTDLARHLRDEEQPKAEKVRTARYLLAVSHSLSRADKTKLVQSMHPHITNDSDVFGAEDLNDLLDRLVSTRMCVQSSMAVN
jgi:hypothetical protein